MCELTVKDTVIMVVSGDITEQDVDVIVNAANNSLMGGGGVDGAIHRAAGPEMLADCKALGGCPTGEAKITKGYNLKAGHVIHTVGPVWKGGDKNEDELLANAYRSSLNLAKQHNFRTISFPSISTGAYRFPALRAAKIAIGQMLEHAGSTDGTSLEEIRMVTFSDEQFAVYKETLSSLPAPFD